MASSFSFCCNHFYILDIFLANALSALMAFCVSASPENALASRSNSKSATLVVAAFKSPGCNAPLSKSACISKTFLYTLSPPLDSGRVTVNSDDGDSVVDASKTKAWVSAIGGQKDTLPGSQNDFFSFDLP